MEDGAEEPACRVEVVCGQYPTYVTIRRQGSNLAVTEVVPLRSGEEIRKTPRPHDDDHDVHMDEQAHHDNELST